MTQGIRYDNIEYDIGDYLPPSRVWIDGKPKQGKLPGTSVLILDQDDYTGERCYGCQYTHKYVVEGRWVADGNDDGEIILADCKVIETIR